MRVASSLALLGVLAGVEAAPVQRPGTEPLLATARGAIGGEQTLRSLQSLLLQGHARVLNGATGKLGGPYPLEIQILLPDHYLRAENRGAFELRAGFAGDRLLSGMVATDPSGSFGSTYGPEEIERERKRFGYLMLGLLAYDPAAARLTFRPTPSPSVVAVLTSDGDSATLELDAGTGMPVRVRYEADVHFPVPGNTMPPAPERAEVVWTYLDRRTVGGLAFPHRIVRTARDITFEEIILERIVLNTLTRKAFAR